MELRGEALRNRVDQYISSNKYVIDCIRATYYCQNWEPKFKFDTEVMEYGKEVMKNYGGVKIATSKWAATYFGFLDLLVKDNERDYAYKLTLFQAFLNFDFIMKKHFPHKFDHKIFTQAIQVSKSKYMKQGVDFTLAKISKDSVDKLFDDYINKFPSERAYVKMYYSKLRHKISQVVKVIAREYYKLVLLSGREVKDNELSTEDTVNLIIERVIRFIRTYDKQSIIELYVDSPECKDHISDFVDLVHNNEESAVVLMKEIIYLKKVDTPYKKCVARFLEIMLEGN